MLSWLQTLHKNRRLMSKPLNKLQLFVCMFLQHVQKMSPTVIYNIRVHSFWIFCDDDNTIPCTVNLLQVYVKTL